MASRKQPDRHRQEWVFADDGTVLSQGSFTKGRRERRDIDAMVIEVADMTMQGLGCEIIALLSGLSSGYTYFLREEAMKLGLIKTGEGNPPFKPGARKMRMTDLGFSLLAPAGPDGNRRAVVRFVCVECSKVLDFPRSNGEALNPEALAKRARNQGWQAGAYRSKAHTYCQTCAGPQAKPKNDTESELKGIKPMAITPAPSSSPPPAVAKELVPEVKLTVPVKSPDKEQRLRIRQELDQWFDDDVGNYLDGYSDQRIAEIVGVPRIAVEQMREVAYGPIRVDAEVVKIRMELATLRNRMDDMQKGLERMKAEGAAIGSHIEQYIAKTAQ